MNIINRVWSHTPVREYWGFSLITCALLMGCQSQFSTSPQPLGASSGVLTKHVAVQVGSAGTSSYPQRISGVAFGVMPFLDPRPQTINGVSEYFRSDFASQMEQAVNWGTISAYSGEYEMYFEALEAAATPTFSNEVSLATLASTLKAQQMKVAFQVPGARPMNGQCTGGGALAAAADIPFLKTWQNAGGSVDKLITDNTFAKYFLSTSPTCYQNPAQIMSIAASELASYFKAMSAAFPGAKFVATDALAQFQVTDPTGAAGNKSLTYPTTVSSIYPVLSLQTYLSDLVQSMNGQGLALNEFVMDCAEAFTYDAAVFPTSRYISQGRNYGRMIAGQKIMQSLGINSGIYWSVFPPSGTVAAEDQDYHDLGVEQVAAFISVGGNVNDHRFTIWTDIPNITGPETTPYTALNDIRDEIGALINEPGTTQSTTSGIPTGDFQIPPTIYHSNGTTYCFYVSWDDYLANGGLSNISGVTSVSSIPSSMRNAGECSITAGNFIVGGVAIFYSNGTNYCNYQSWSQFTSITGLTSTSSVRVIDVIPTSMTFQGGCQ